MAKWGKSKPLGVWAMLINWIIVLVIAAVAFANMRQHGGKETRELNAISKFREAIDSTTRTALATPIESRTASRFLVPRFTSDSVEFLESLDLMGFQSAIQDDSREYARALDQVSLDTSDGVEALTGLVGNERRLMRSLDRVERARIDQAFEDDINRSLIISASLLLSMFTTGWFAISADKRRKATELAAKGKEEADKGWMRFRLLAEEAPTPVILLDDQGIVNGASKNFVDTLGLMMAPHRLEIERFVYPEDLAVFEGVMQELREGAPTTNAQVRLMNELGEVKHFELSFTNLLHDPIARGVLIAGRDVSENIRLHAQLQRQANEDALTGLPNRFRFMAEVESLLVHGHQDLVAVLFVDLDNFKVVNDSLGHAAGDALLLTVADRLRDCIRPTDMIARLGGDEFVILLRGVTHNDEAKTVGDRILKSLARPTSLLGHDVVVSASIGIAFAEQGTDVDELLRDADVAMYEAKEAGRSRAVEASVDTKSKAKDRLQIESDLRRAIDNEELCLHFQPIVDLGTGRILNLEALVRWNHPERGMIPPSSFVPIAEQSGLITRLGEWVLEAGCLQLAQWHRQLGEAAIGLNVNVSTQQLKSDAVFDHVHAALTNSGIPAECLKLEITESVMMRNIDHNVALLHRIRELGVSLAIDDFGTGYSSMSYLSQLPVQGLKVDRAFVARLGSDQVNEEDTMIIRSIISLAQALNLTVTCEGIEHADQLEILRGLGADFGQGYFFSKPLPAELIGNMLQRQTLAA